MTPEQFVYFVKGVLGWEGVPNSIQIKTIADILEHVKLNELTKVNELEKEIAKEIESSPEWFRPNYNNPVWIVPEYYRQYPFYDPYRVTYTMNTEAIS